MPRAGIHLKIHPPLEVEGLRPNLDMASKSSTFSQRKAESRGQLMDRSSG